MRGCRWTAAAALARRRARQPIVRTNLSVSSASSSEQLGRAGRRSRGGGSPSRRSDPVPGRSPGRRTGRRWCRRRSGGCRGRRGSRVTGASRPSSVMVPLVCGNDRCTVQYHASPGRRSGARPRRWPPTTATRSQRGTGPEHAPIVPSACRFASGGLTTAQWTVVGSRVVRVPTSSARPEGACPCPSTSTPAPSAASSSRCVRASPTTP